MTSLDPAALPHLYQEELYVFSSPVLVILPQPWERYVPSEQVLLEKILTSVKVDPSGVRVVVQPTVQLESLEIFSPSRVLIFGSEISDDVPLYKETAAQGFTVIRAEDLGQLDDQKKKNLWLALRQVFGV